MRIVAYQANDRERTDPLRVDEVVEQATWPFEGAWYYGYNEDQFDPTRYLVRGAGRSDDEAWQDAWNQLTCHPRIERELDITSCWGADEVAAFMKDADGCTSGVEYNDNGLYLDVESLVLWATPVQVRLEREAVLAL